MVIGIILLVIGIVISVALFCLDDDYGSWSCIATTIAVLGTVIIMCGLSKRPSAIDVYRGKTTLQVIYQDSIPVDSVVVYKNK